MRSAYSVIASVVVLTVCSAMGQSTFGSIVGVVNDKTQAVIPGATVKIENLEDSSVRSATSDQNGAFEFINLKPGKYSVSVNAEGFADFQIATAELTARQALRIDATLGVKSQSQTVEVSNTVAVINTENATISDSIGNQRPRTGMSSLRTSLNWLHGRLPTRASQPSTTAASPLSSANRGQRLS